MTTPSERSAEGWTIDTLKTLIDRELHALREQHGAAVIASEKAINKAEIATEKRFDGVNEFRSALSDQATKLLTRAEYEANHKALENKVTVNGNSVQVQISALQSRLDTWDGKAKGIGEGWGVLVAGAGLAVGIALAIAGFMSH